MNGKLFGARRINVFFFFCCFFFCCFFLFCFFFCCFFLLLLLFFLFFLFFLLFFFFFFFFFVFFFFFFFFFSLFYLITNTYLSARPLPSEDDNNSKGGYTFKWVYKMIFNCDCCRYALVFAHRVFLFHLLYHGIKRHYSWYHEIPQNRNVNRQRFKSDHHTPGPLCHIFGSRSKTGHRSVY